MTLIEVVLASALTLLLMSVGYVVLNSSVKTAAAVTNRAVNANAARLAIDELEGDLRYANGVWLCPAATATPQTAGTASTGFCPTPGIGTSLVVSVDPALSSGSTGIDPTCSEWTFSTSPSGLYEVDLGTASGSSIPVTPVINMRGAVAAPNATGSATGFSLPVTTPDAGDNSGAETNRLVEIDLGVNQESALQYNASDTVTVHDLVAPQNLPLQDDASSTPCT